MIESFKLNAKDSAALRQMFAAHEPGIEKVRQKRARLSKLKNKDEY
jgi:hypothetical protein